MYPVLPRAISNMNNNSSSSSAAVASAAVASNKRKMDGEPESKAEKKHKKV
jgi:hypothetical protein